MIIIRKQITQEHTLHTGILASDEPPSSLFFLERWVSPHHIKYMYTCIKM